jgi:hypothetical protein
METPTRSRIPGNMIWHYQHRSSLFKLFGGRLRNSAHEPAWFVVPPLGGSGAADRLKPGLHGGRGSWAQCAKENLGGLIFACLERGLPGRSGPGKRKRRGIACRVRISLRAAPRMGALRVKMRIAAAAHIPARPRCTASDVRRHAEPRVPAAKCARHQQRSARFSFLSPRRRRAEAAL